MFNLENPHCARFILAYPHIVAASIRFKEWTSANMGLLRFNNDKYEHLKAIIFFAFLRVKVWQTKKRWSHGLRAEGQRYTIPNGQLAFIAAQLIWLTSLQIITHLALHQCFCNVYFIVFSSSWSISSELNLDDRPTTFQIFTQPSKWFHTATETKDVWGN